MLGSAVEVLMALVRNVGLTDVVLMSPMDIQVINMIEDTLAHQKQQGRVFVVPQREGRSVQSRTSAESRAMMSMAYFHTTPPSNPLSGIEQDIVGAGTKWDVRPLRSHRPWCVKYFGPDQGMLGIASYGELVDPDFLATVIDGMVLAICVIEDDAAFPSLAQPPYSESGNGEEADHNTEDGGLEKLDKLAARTPEGIPYLLPDRSGLIPPLDPRFSRCLGLALVRGIDVANTELQLLTSVPAAEIQQCCLGEVGVGEDGPAGQRVVLVRGKFDCPDWALLEDVFAGGVGGGEGERPYVAVRGAEGGSGLGGNVWRVRHLPRKMGGGDAGGGGA